MPKMLNHLNSNLKTTVERFINEAEHTLYTSRLQLCLEESPINQPFLYEILVHLASLVHPLIEVPHECQNDVWTIVKWCTKNQDTKGWKESLTRKTTGWGYSSIVEDLQDFTRYVFEKVYQALQPKPKMKARKPGGKTALVLDKLMANQGLVPTSEVGTYVNPDIVKLKKRKPKSPKTDKEKKAKIQEEKNGSTDN